MCYSVKVLAIIMILAETQSKSTEVFDSPSTIIFHDIYTANFPTVTEEDYSSTTEEDFTVKQAQFVEFYPVVTTERPTKLAPNYIESFKFSTITTSTSTTEDPEDNIKVVPVKKHYQRGLLDLLFPPKRVKTFKHLFDSLRRMLSHTFRR